MTRIPRRVKPARRTAAMVIGDGLLLVLALVGVFLFQFNVYGLPGSHLAVLCACLAAAVLFLTAFSLPKYRWAAVMTLVLLGLVLLWQYWEDVVQGAQAVYSTAAHVITESTDFPGEYPIPEEWTQEEIWAASNRFLTALIFALALPLSWAVVCRRAFLPVLLLTLPWLIPIFLAEFLPDVISLSMLAACWMTMVLTSLAARRNPEGGARLTLAVLPAALLALCCVCLIFPAGDYAYPDWAATTAQRFIEIGEDVWVKLGGGNASERVDLVHSGPKRYTGKPVLKVESDWTGRLYLRGAAYANYTGGSWERLSDEALAELETVTLEDALVLPLKDGREEQANSADITHLNGSTRMAYYLYQPVNLSETLSAVSYVDDSYLCLENPRKEYTVEFSDSDGMDRAVNDEAYSQFVYEHYLNVPEELTDVLVDWWKKEAKQIRIQGNQTYEILIAQGIAEHLEETTEYDLQTPLTPEGEDFVAYFLTTSHRGYCVHYASAAVLLLRMLGVPARYVSGYTAEIADGEALIPDSAAHAWVEVYLAGCGWYPVEVTPADAFDNGAGGSVAIEETMPSAEPTLTPMQSEPPEKPDLYEEEGAGEGEEKPVNLVLLCCAAAALVILGLPVLMRTLRRRRWNRLTDLPDNNRAVLEAYGWYHKLPAWGGKPDCRMEELACKAKFSQHTLTDEERREALTLLRCEITRLSAQRSRKRILFRFLFVWK